MTLGQETTWAYSTTLPSPHEAVAIQTEYYFMNKCYNYDNITDYKSIAHTTPYSKISKPYASP